MDKELTHVMTLGPIYPYRGGIAQYGGLLVKNLQKKYNVLSISYSKMYPDFLYPGKNQKDFDNDLLKYEKTQFILNTVNPCSYIRTARSINNQKPDLLIIHWWHPFFAFAYLAILMLLNEDIKICICCNNVMPHDKIFFSEFLTKLILKRGDCFLIHSKEEEEIFRNILPYKKNYTTTVCPNLNVCQSKGYSKESARNELGILENDKILLFFGFVRKYKGLQYLLKAMPEVIKKHKNLKLWIVGEFYDDKEEYMKLIRERKIEEYVIIHERFIPDNEVEKYVKASDIVVLPYETATTSGVIQVAYQHDRPVIVSDVGGLPEVVKEKKTGLLFPPCDVNELANKIEYFFSEGQQINWATFIQETREEYSWDRIIERIEDLWKGL